MSSKTNGAVEPEKVDTRTCICGQKLGGKVRLDGEKGDLHYRRCKNSSHPLYDDV